MRLIDADEFKRDIMIWQKIDRSEYVHALGNKMLNLIDQRNTINTLTEKHEDQKNETSGEWIYDRIGHYYCSNCHTMMSRLVCVYNYCYNCGSKNPPIPISEIK